jgi:hypothetical protein
LKFTGFTDDATVLVIEFTCEGEAAGQLVSLDYVFGSFEYFELIAGEATANPDIVAGKFGV